MTPGWRPALRIARRDALRNKGRTALILLMVLLPSPRWSPWTRCCARRRSASPSRFLPNSATPRLGFTSWAAG